MMQHYVLACMGVALLSLLPWALVALFPTGAGVGPSRGHDPLPSTLIALGIIWAYPIFLGLFAHRAWSFFREEDYENAAGPATLIAVPALLLVLYYVLFQPAA
jgi:hypothetical protein